MDKIKNLIHSLQIEAEETRKDVVVCMTDYQIGRLHVIDSILTDLKQIVDDYEHAKISL